MYLFLMQMAQLPLILMGRASIFKKYPGLGNVSQARTNSEGKIRKLIGILCAQIFFWIGLMSGFPMLAVGYLCM